MSVRLSGITKYYKRHLVLDDVSLDVADGELVILLGASGSGKTTLLMSIAGFVRPDRGRVEVAGHDVTNVPENEREIGFVFQSSALFPHLDVYGNIAFPLRVRRYPAKVIADKVHSVMQLVSITPLEHSRIDELSGGQRQRVALARALVFEPRILLMDEPMSALDRSLRRDLQQELRSLQRRLGTTTVFVTHDQEEAVILGDRIGVLNGGRIEQYADSQSLYRRPRTEYVARFFGDANVMARGVGETAAPGIDDGPLMFRPEAVAFDPPVGDLGLRLPVLVIDRQFLRETELLVLEVADGTRLTARLSSTAASGSRLPKPGQRVDIFVDARDIVHCA